MALWQTTQTPDDGYTNTHMAKGSTISLEELYKCVCTLSTAWITAMQQQCSVYCSCNMQYVPNSTSTNQIRISNVITLTKNPLYYTRTTRVPPTLHYVMVRGCQQNVTSVLIFTITLYSSAHTDGSFHKISSSNVVPIICYRTTKSSIKIGHFVACNM